MAAGERDTAGPADEAEFEVLAARHRGELRAHCYRMIGSVTEAEDLVQETLLRAWRRRDTFEGRSSYRAWLYRIATNVCLDFFDHTARRPALLDSGGSPAEVPWLEPYPDHLLPDVMIEAKETIELAFLTAIQLLPPNQRAVLILRGILEWSAAETAAALDTSVSSVNSALQRARAELARKRPADALPEPDAPTADERTLLARYMEAHERADAQAVIDMLRADVRFTMPPQPVVHEGRAALTAFFEDAFGAGRPGEFRMVPIKANRQLATAIYLREWGKSEFTAMSLDVLRFEAGGLAEITTFEPRLFAAFGLPEVFSPER